MQIRKIATRCQSALRATFLRPPLLFVSSVSMLGLVLTPLAVLAGMLGAWRLGADPGWTSRFFIADGLLSRYQLWFAGAIGAQTFAFILNRWGGESECWRSGASPDRRYTTMTPTELARLRGALEARQADLEDLLRNREVIAVVSNADMLDQIQHASERDMAIGNLERESTRLREVRAALRRIHLGTFGICVDCEEEISLKRLTALPWTPSCLVCQEAADRRLPQNSSDEPFLSAA